MGKVIKTLPEADELGAGKSQHFGKWMSSGTNEDFFSPPFQ